MSPDEEFNEDEENRLENDIYYCQPFSVDDMEDF
jgi:hypothetical protein